MQIPNPLSKAGLEGVRGRKIATSQAPVRNPPIRNPRNPWLLEREMPVGHRSRARAQVAMCT
eukprot:7576757-Alexandrium_andersonii.AAC.1